MSQQWAVVKSNGDALLINAKTERGAKCYATRNGYKLVCRVSPYSMSCYNILVKVGRYWVPQQ